MEGEVEGEGGVVDLPHPTGGITMAHRLVAMILTLMTVLHHLADLRRPTRRVTTLYPLTGTTMYLGTTAAAPRRRVRRSNLVPSPRERSGGPGGPPPSIPSSPPQVGGTIWHRIG